MSHAHATEVVLEQLSSVLESERFPSEARLLGSRLLDRLRTPVQIVVIGKPQSGKSRLINMLLGKSLYPQIAELPTCEIVYGEAERLFVIRAENAIQEWRAEADVAFPEDTVMVRLELPLPILNKFNLTEVTVTSASEDQHDLVQWATERADIALWCTQNFDPLERALWEPAQDTLKDHSFLVITKADQLLMKGVLQDRIADLEEVVAQEFHSLYSIATIQAISAQSDSDGPDPEVWAASGGHALNGAVLRLVETGRRADTDNALLFLSRFSAAASQIDQHFTPPGADKSTSRTTTVKRVGVSSAPPDSMGSGQRNREIFVEALDYLQDRAEKMLATCENPDTAHSNLILDHCLDTANQLSDLLQDFEASDPALKELQEDVLESADMMLLLRLEQTEDAAADAVTLLLQLKKEVAEKTAG